MNNKNNKGERKMQAKTKQEREKLEENLTALIIKNNGREDIYNSILKELKDKMNDGDIAQIWGLNRPLRYVNDMELLLFSKAVYKFTKEEAVNPNQVFTDNDFKEALHVSKKKPLAQDKWILKNVTQIKEGIWNVPFVSCRELVLACDNGVVGYNYDAQRDPLKKKVLGEEILKPKIFDEKTKEIANDLVHDRYIPVDTLIINILKTGAEHYDWKPETKELILYKPKEIGSTNDLNDGANRNEASRLALSMKPDLSDDIGFGLKVTNFTLADSQRCIKQINKQTPISEEKIKTFEPTKYMKIAKELNVMEKENNLLFEKFGDSINDLKLFNKISTIQILSDAIEDSFKDEIIKSPIYTGVLDYLFDFFNMYFSNYVDYVNDVEKCRKNSVLFDVNMFFVHVQIGKKLYPFYKKNKREWRQLVCEVTNQIDFEKSNSEWDSLKTTGNLSKNNKTLLINYINKKVDECLLEIGGTNNDE